MLPADAGPVSWGPVSALGSPSLAGFGFGANGRGGGGGSCGMGCEDGVEAISVGEDDEESRQRKSRGHLAQLRKNNGQLSHGPGSGMSIWERPSSFHGEMPSREMGSMLLGSGDQLGLILRSGRPCGDHSSVSKALIACLGC